MGRNILIIILFIIVCILSYFAYSNYSILANGFKETILNKNEKIVGLESTIEVLNKDLSNEKSKNLELIQENSDLKLKITNLEEKITSQGLNVVVSDFNESPSLLNIKEDSIIKFTEMNIGEWTLNNNKKSYILSLFKENKAIYEIIPIVDETLYKNDEQGLKQLGLSRQRAAVAAGLIKSINKENKVFISTEILTSKNERGFIVKKINFK